MRHKDNCRSSTSISCMFMRQRRDRAAKTQVAFPGCSTAGCRSIRSASSPGRTSITYISTSSSQSRNVKFDPEMSSLHWKSQQRNVWGQQKRVATLWRCLGSSSCIFWVVVCNSVKFGLWSFAQSCWQLAGCASITVTGTHPYTNQHLTPSFRRCTEQVSDPT